MWSAFFGARAVRRGLPALFLSLPLVGACGSGDSFIIYSHQVGSVELAMTLSGGTTADFIDTALEGGNRKKTIQRRVPMAVGSSTVAAFYEGLSLGSYTVELNAESRDGSRVCKGLGQFDVKAPGAAYVLVVLDCSGGGGGVGGAGGESTGDLEIELRQCPTFDFLFVAPLVAEVGQEIQVEAKGNPVGSSELIYRWNGTSGAFADPDSAITTYRCDEPGNQTLAVTMGDGTGCSETRQIDVQCLAAAPADD